MFVHYNIEKCRDLTCNLKRIKSAQSITRSYHTCVTLCEGNIYVSAQLMHDIHSVFNHISLQPTVLYTNPVFLKCIVAFNGTLMEPQLCECHFQQVRELYQWEQHCTDSFT